MKKKKLRILFTAASLICACSIGVGLTKIHSQIHAPAEKYEVVFDEAVNLLEEYAYGERVTIPSGKVGGVAASKVVVFSPSGKTYDSPSVLLNEKGQYTITWYATVSGRTVSAQKTFTVTQSVFTVGENSSWEYVEQLRTVEETDKDEDGNLDKTSGLKVTLADGEVFRYNQVIDLSDPETPFISFFPYSFSGLVQGENKQAEVSEYRFTLTDAYDPSLTVTIYMTYDYKNTASDTAWVLSVKVNDSKLAGLRTRTLSWLEKNGRDYLIVDGKYYQIEQSWRAAPSSTVTDNYGLQLYYDAETNMIKQTYNASAASASPVSDLDNEKLFPGTSFTGFTTGEAYLSISAYEYTGKMTTFELESLGGISGEDLTKINTKDTVPATIKVSDEFSSGDIAIALGETLEIPDAYVYDLSVPLGTKADFAVYYAYNPNSEKNELVGVKNGCFTPTKIGAYTLVYTAKDGNGNVGRKTIGLNCTTGIENKAVALTVDKEMEGQAGTHVELPTCTLTGLYTDAENIKTYVQFGMEERKEVDGSTLFLSGTGQYSLIYEYTTPFKTYTATCILTAKASNVVDIESPILPEYMIKGMRYTLDKVGAYTYQAEKPTLCETVVSISEDGKAYAEIDYDNFIVNASETVQFRYAYGEAVRYSETIEVVDVGFNKSLSMQSYFKDVNEQFNVSSSSKGIQFLTKTDATEATLSYVNVISLSAFAIDFQLLSSDGAEENPITYGTSTFVKFTLIDYYNRDNKLEILYTNKKNQASVSVNGGAMKSLNADYADKKVSISLSEEGVIAAKTTINYQKDFASDKAFLHIELGGVSGEACLNISKLNSVTLSARNVDNGRPTISVNTTEGNYDVNSIVTLSTASATDVFTPYLQSGLSLEVLMPNGDYATSTDGVLLDGTCAVGRTYQIKLEALGAYNVTYRYVDQSDNDNSISYTMSVADRVPPSLTVEGLEEGDVLTALYGETVKVKGCTYSDNISSPSDINIWVAVFSPLQVITKLEPNGEFLVDRKGDWTVMYYCIDETGNYKTFTYILRVTK